MSIPVAIVMGLFISAGIQAPVQAQAPASQPSRVNSAPGPLRPDKWQQMDLDSQVRWLLSQMTLAEKVEQLNIQPVKEKRTKELGSRSQLWNTRLGIGPILATNGPRGPRSSGVIPKRDTHESYGCVSPSALALASTWNPTIQFEVGQQWGQLVKEYGLNTLWAPGLNIIKDPRAGRNTDYASEDPYLTGATGVALTRGIQSVGVAATIKHLAANNWESGRQSHNVEVSIRSLREIYLPAFQMAVEEAGAMGIMTCYNSLNGAWGSANQWLLTGVVRKEWGFKGFFVSDWGANFGSAAQAIKAGQNIELPGLLQWNLKALADAIKSGEITEADIDARVGELLRLKLGRLTYWGDDTPSGYQAKAFSEVMRRAGGESIVLLKNTGRMLPLQKSQSVALIGPFADNDELMIGNAGSSTVPAGYVVTVKQALLAQGLRVNYEQGGDDAFAYIGAKFAKALPCRIDYYNGLSPTGAVVHSLQAESLVLNEIKASGIPVKIVSDGFKGNGLHSSGTSVISPMGTPHSPWTVRVHLRLEDQLPAANLSIIRFYANQQVVQITSSELQVNQGDTKQNLPMSWRDMDKRWVDLIISHDGSALTVYREGTLLTKISGVGPLEPQRIIFGHNGEGLPMDIDELQVWDVALTPSQLVEHQVLRGESFENFTPAAQKTVAGVPGIRSTQDMSLRATAAFTPERPGKVAFQVETSGGVRVRLDGQLVYDLNDEQKAGGTKNQFWHIFGDTNPHPLVVEYSSKQKYGDAGYLRLLYAQPPATNIFARAAAVASTSDVAVVCVGVPSKQQEENKDRPRIELPSWQDELITAVHKANPRTVVVLFTEGGVDVRPWIDAIPAALVAFHPGSEGGHSIADVLYGDMNPAGRLTVTWPKANEDLPASGPNPHYKDTVNEFGYRYFDAIDRVPMFAFGYGLSYTTFEYSDLQVQTMADTRYPVAATVTLRNTGAVAGKEVVQVYASDVKSTVEQPRKKLAGFSKVDLKPGETKTVRIPLHWTAFQFFDVKANKWVLEPGEFVIRSGGASDRLPLQSAINL